MSFKSTWMLFFFLSLPFLGCSETVESQTSPSFCSQKKESVSVTTNTPFSDDTDAILQIGDQVSREPISREQLQDPFLGPAIRSYVSFFDASGFYLGEFRGWHLIGTSYHFTSDQKCQEGLRFFMPFARYRGQSELCVLSDPEIDLRILAFRENQNRFSERLSQVSIKFDFDNTPEQNEPLFVIGKTIRESGRPGAYLIQDEDCRITSRTGDIGQVPTPIGTIRAFAMGCDVSQGDSGAAVRSRKTGLIKGLVSHATPQRSQNFSCSEGIQKQLDFNYNSVWDMNLVTPASDYKARFLQFSQDQNQDELSRNLIKDLLNSHGNH